jgi:mannan endo-1,4-beta-mannosidase
VTTALVSGKVRVLAGEQAGSSWVRHAVLRACALVALAALLTVVACGPATHSQPPITIDKDRGSWVPVPGASVAPALAGVVAPPASGAYIGIYQPPAPFDIASLDAYRALSNKPPAIVMWYQPWTKAGPRDFDPAAAVAVFQRGAVPMVTWEPWDPGTDANALKAPANQPAYRLANIINGSFDSYIRSFAKDVKSVRGPVMIRLMHEMNGNWYPWSGTANGNTPSQFVAAWRHVHDIFEQQGATNVTWVWSVNHESVPHSAANSYAAYYPGDKYVDWVSISGFNWGTSTPGNSWHALDFWYKKPMAYLTRTGKPIIVSEFASVENGGDKAAWITDAYTRFRVEYPAVKAVVYYNKREWQRNSIQDWRINTSQKSSDAYRAAVASPYYLAAPAKTLSAWTGALTTANWVYLRALKPLY